MRCGGVPARLCGAVFAAFSLALSAAQVQEDGTQFIMVSQPRLASIVYMQYNVFTMTAGQQTYPLVTSGLTQPYGIAFDRARQHLYVADAGMGKVYLYKLIFQNGVITTDGLQYVAISGLNPRWVAVDDLGTLYCTDEGTNVIAKVTLDQIERSDASSQILFSGSSINSVSGPGGIAVDGMAIFWGNKVDGESRGSIVRANEHPDPEDPAGSVAKLSANIGTTYGVCASQNNVFYSGEARYLYGVKKTASTDSPSAATVADVLVQPRGCAWDGDGTVYVADKGGNAVWGFPCQMHTLGPAEISRLFEIEDPFGVAVYRSAPPQPVTNTASRATTFLLGGDAIPRDGRGGFRTLVAVCLALGSASARLRQ